MHRTARRTSLALVSAGALVLTPALMAPAQAHGTHHGPKRPVVVASHLNNPRQLAIGSHHALLVAQAGRGGPDCQGSGEGGDPFCLGDSSVISQLVQHGKKSRLRTVAGGLPSGAGPDGSFAIGTNGVGADGDGTVYGVNSASAGPAPADSPAGKLFKVRKGHLTIVADIAGYEAAKDPDGQGPDSDAYSVLVQRDRILVADAAGNDVVSVSKRGKISTFHVFANITTGPCADAPPEAPGRNPGCDFVPTALAAGPKGSVFVTGLAAETPGEGRVVQLSGKGKVLHKWSGFTAPTGVVAGEGGGFYVSELFTNLDEQNPDPPNVGQVTRVDRHGARTSRVIPLPAGLVIIGHQLYVSVYSIAPSDGLFGNPAWNGQIWRLSL